MAVAPLDPVEPLAGRRILVAGSGSIAAVKLPQLVSALVQRGAKVRCLLSPSAAEPRPLRAGPASRRVNRNRNRTDIVPTSS